MFPSRTAFLDNVNCFHTNGWSCELHAGIHTFDDFGPTISTDNAITDSDFRRKRSKDAPSRPKGFMSTLP